MPPVTLDAAAHIESSPVRTNISRHLTESVLTLQATIRNVREDVKNGIAPSILMPTSTLEDGVVFLSLEPSASTIKAELGPLNERLSVLEKRLQYRGQWQPSLTPPKSPEYSIIDISDLSAAIKLLEDIFQHPHPSKPLSPQAAFSRYNWTWDPAWKEFYTPIPDEDSFIYLCRWRLDEARQVWEHVSMDGSDLLPDSAAESLASWDDWIWDPVWKEWYLDVSDEDGRCCIYGSWWRVQEDGQWVYVERHGSLEV